jgi:hypothetical protein
MTLHQVLVINVAQRGYVTYAMDASGHLTEESIGRTNQRISKQFVEMVGRVERDLGRRKYRASVTVARRDPSSFCVMLGYLSREARDDFERSGILLMHAIECDATLLSHVLHVAQKFHEWIDELERVTTHVAAGTADPELSVCARTTLFDDLETTTLPYTEWWLRDADDSKKQHSALEVCSAVEDVPRTWRLSDAELGNTPPCWTLDAAPLVVAVAPTPAPAPTQASASRRAAPEQPAPPIMVRRSTPVCVASPASSQRLPWRAALVSLLLTSVGIFAVIGVLMWVRTVSTPREPHGTTTHEVIPRTPMPPVVSTTAQPLPSHDDVAPATVSVGDAGAAVAPRRPAAHPSHEHTSQPLLPARSEDPVRTRPPEQFQLPPHVVF